MQTAATVRANETWWKDRSALLWSIALGCLIVLLYGSVLASLVSDWWTDPDYGHGFFIPLFSAYVLYRERERWTNTPVKPSNFGLLVMVGAVGLFLVGSLGAELFTARFSLLVLLAGMILFLAGWRMLRAVAFPLGFLILMIPLPNIVYNQITFPLQLFASRFATFWLELFRVPVLRDGNILLFSNYSLEVVEACSGIRSLMTLISLAIVYGYLMEPRRHVRYALVLLMVPIAVVSNAIRIMGAGLMARHFGPAAAEGFLHEFSGWVIFLAALLLLLGCHWLLRRIPPRRKVESHA
ncbi:MAG: exosortase/archaeosortase family protein [Candidatus Acidiferrales bacterium]